MILTLKKRGVFLGVTPYYDNAGNLVFRFNNPPAVSGNSLNNVKIVIDPGHGGNDTGALGYLGAYPEKVVNYAVASKLASILQSRGATVVMYDTRNTTISLEQRAHMAASADPHLFISVHANSSAYNRAAVGSEAYYFNPFSYAFAQLSAGNISNALNTVNRGGKFGYYYVVRSMQYPAILVEMGFMSNQTEYSKLVNTSYQNNIATALANSVVSYFKLMGVNAGLTGTQKSTLSAAPTPPASSSAQSTSGEAVEAGAPSTSESTDLPSVSSS
jgi:N-acetylmuramoyl-L-alanine amidase